MVKRQKSDVRISVIGGSGVGKSAIIVRFLTRRYIGEYQRNVEQIYKGCVHFGENAIRYEMRDCAGLPNDSVLKSWSTSIAIIYSIDDIKSFTTASEYLENVDSSSTENDDEDTSQTIALIGNKSELHHLRKIAEKEGKELAQKHNAKFWEVSAADSYESISQVFESLIIHSFLKSKVYLRSFSSPGCNRKFSMTTSDNFFQELKVGKDGSHHIPSSLHRHNETRHRSHRNVESNPTIKAASAIRKGNSLASGIPCITISFTDTSSEVSPSSSVDSPNVLSSKSCIERKIFTFPTSPEREINVKSPNGNSGENSQSCLEHQPISRSRSLPLHKQSLEDPLEENCNIKLLQKVPHASSAENLNEQMQKKDESVPTSYKHLSDESKRTLWSKLRNDRVKALSRSTEGMSSDSFGSNEDITKKSFRRKISGKFRSRTPSGSSD